MSEPEKLTNAEQLDALNEHRKELVLRDREGNDRTVTIKEVGLDILVKWHKQPPEAPQKCIDFLDLAREAAVALYDALTTASKLQLYKEGSALNDPFFGEYLAVHKSSQEAYGIDPEQQERIQVRALATSMLLAGKLKDDPSDGQSSSPPSPDTATP